MGVKVKAGMWCEYCVRPVAGQKSTHRLRNGVAAVLAAPTGGAALLGARADGYHCPICGQPVRKLRTTPGPPNTANVAGTSPGTAEEPAPPPVVDPSGPPPRQDDFADRASYLRAHAAYGAARRAMLRGGGDSSRPIPPDVMRELEALAARYQRGELTRTSYEAEKTRIARSSIRPAQPE